MKKILVLFMSMVLCLSVMGCNKTQTGLNVETTKDEEYDEVAILDIEKKPQKFDGKTVEIEELFYVLSSFVDINGYTAYYASPIREIGGDKVLLWRDAYIVCPTPETEQQFVRMFEVGTTQEHIIKLVTELYYTSAYDLISFSPKEIIMMPELLNNEEFLDLTEEDFRRFEAEAEEFIEIEEERTRKQNVLYEDDGVEFSNLQINEERGVITVDVYNSATIAQRGHVMISCKDEDDLQVKKLNINYDINALSSTTIQGNLPEGTVSVEISGAVVLER